MSCPQEVPASTPLLYYDETQGRVVSEVPQYLIHYNPEKSSITPPPGYSFVYLDSLSSSNTPSSSPPTQVQTLNLLQAFMNYTAAMSGRKPAQRFPPNRSRSVSPEKDLPAPPGRPQARLQRNIKAAPKGGETSPGITKHERIQSLLKWMEDSFGDEGSGIYNKMHQTEGANVIRVDVKTLPGVDFFRKVLLEIMEKCSVSALSTRSSLKRNKQRKGISVYIKVASAEEIKRTKEILSSFCDRAKIFPSDAPLWTIRDIPAYPSWENVGA